MSDIQDFSLSVNLLESLIWQYNEAEHLQKMIQQKQDWTEENVINFMDDFYNNVFNIDTANDFGLNIWAIILDLDFAVAPEPVRNDAFGFDPFWDNFHNTNFSPPAIVDRSLTTDQKRLIIKLTFQKYHVFPSVPEINKILRSVLGDTSYIIDGLNMNVIVIVDSEVAQSDIDLLRDYDLLPIPASVGYDIIRLRDTDFGFDPYMINFFNGTFAI